MTNRGGGAGVLGRAARRVLWALPERLKLRLSLLYKSLAGRRPVQQSPTEEKGEVEQEEKIDFPPDLTDREALRDFLLEAALSGFDEAERRAYLWHALERFRITLAVTPALDPNAKVLELGANPYFFTRMLLRRGLDVTCANWFGDQSIEGTKGTQHVVNSRTGESLAIEYDHFDIEQGRFPYDSDKFDAVYFCEILEHLALDPINALAEIHRVLKKPGGLLILSTPNPVRQENLVKMLKGENVYEPMSGYGVQGRHNREYTVAELKTIFSELGFDPIRVFTADVNPVPPESVARMPQVVSTNRGEYVFAVAGAFGPDRWRYPEWLYQSRQALWRVVLPDMEVGRNDDLQTDGFLEREHVLGREARWIPSRQWARVLVSPRFSGPGILRIELLGPPEGVSQRTTLAVRHNDVQTEHVIPASGEWYTLEIPTEVLPTDQEVHVSAEGAWSPRSYGVGSYEGEVVAAISTLRLAPS